jgi:uncharacterized membrane protein YtjA (UPF0391 family)
MGLLGWALVALVVALVAGLLGFGGIARGASRIARFLFAIFLILAAVLFIMQLLG